MHITRQVACPVSPEYSGCFRTGRARTHRAKNRPLKEKRPFKGSEGLCVAPIIFSRQFETLTKQLFQLNNWRVRIFEVSKYFQLSNRQKEALRVLSVGVARTGRLNAGFPFDRGSIFQRELGDAGCFKPGHHGDGRQRDVISK